MLDSTWKLGPRDALVALGLLGGVLGFETIAEATAIPRPNSSSEPSAEIKLSFDETIALAAGTARVVASQRAVTTKRALNDRISWATGNPQLSAQPGYRLAPSGARAPEWVIELVQPWSLAGQGNARKVAASVEEQLLAADGRRAALEQRLGAARAWIDLWEAQRLLATAQQQEASALELEKLIARATEAGAATRADLADTHAFRSEARLAALAAEGEVHDRGLALARELGRVTIQPLAARGELPQPPGVAPALAHGAAATSGPSIHGSPASWEAVVAHLPAVRFAELQAQVVRLHEAEERAMRGSHVQLGAGVQRDSPGGFVVSGLARLTLSLFDRGERERGVLAAEAERLDGQRRSARSESTVAIGLVLHEVEHTAEVAAELESSTVPASREAAELRRRIFLGGEATMVELLQSERLALAAVSRLERAKAAHAWARVQAWLLLASAALAQGGS